MLTSALSLCGCVVRLCEWTLIVASMCSFVPRRHPKYNVQVCTSVTLRVHHVDNVPNLERTSRLCGTALGKTKRGHQNEGSAQNVKLFSLVRFACSISSFKVYCCYFCSVWLNDMTVKKLVLLIKSIDTNDVVERWQFDVVCDKSYKTDP